MATEKKQKSVLYDENSVSKVCTLYPVECVLPNSHGSAMDDTCLRETAQWHALYMYVKVVCFSQIEEVNDRIGMVYSGMGPDFRYTI